MYMQRLGRNLVYVSYCVFPQHPQQGCRVLAAVMALVLRVLRESRVNTGLQASRVSRVLQGRPACVTCPSATNPMTSGMSATVKGLISDVRMSEHMGSALGLPEAPQQIQRNLLTWLWTLSVHCYGAMNNQGPVDEVFRCMKSWCITPLIQGINA